MMTLDRRSLLTMLAAMPLAGCAMPLAAPPRSFRLVTYNIWHDAGDWRIREPLLMAALREVDADVIVLQEVLEDADTGLANQASTIAQAVGGYSVHFQSTDAADARRRYGNAILSRLPVRDVGRHLLEPQSDFRTALRVRVDLDGTPVDIVGTHLAAPRDAGPIRQRQVADLLGWLPGDDVPVVVAGDFNAAWADPEMRALHARFDSVLTEAMTDTTLVTELGHRRSVIDLILPERRSFSAANVRRFGDRPVNGRFPSDHFGVAADLRLGAHS